MIQMARYKLYWTLLAKITLTGINLGPAKRDTLSYDMFILNI